MPLTRLEQEQKLTSIMSKFISLVSIKLPDDVQDKLETLAEQEEAPLAKEIYRTMEENQRLAWELKRPCCQDTGVLQFFVTAGDHFPLLGSLKDILKDAVIDATEKTPLRHNIVETFQEYNTGLNVGEGTPSIFIDIKKDASDAEIYTYMAGGGCTLPGTATVLMPGEGYEGVVRFVLDRMTSYGLNACPPLLVGSGIGTSVETAALNSKLALMRPIGSHNKDERAADLERRMEDGINKIGIGPQGFGGTNSVMGVNIVNTARHPSTLAVAVNTGCWSHRRGLIHIDENLNYHILSHKGVEL